MLTTLVLLFFQAQAADPAALFQQGKLAEAEQVLRSQLNQTPADARSLMLLGVVLDAQQRYSDAEPFYQRAVKAAPDAAPVWNNLGNHWLARKRWEDAQRAFERVVAIDAAHINANLQLARLAVQQKQGQRAVGYLNRLPASGDPALSVLRAQAFVLSRDFAQAETAYAAALERAPGDLDLLYNLGLAAYHAGHRGRAIEVLSIARQKRPADPDLLTALARAYLDDGQLNQALSLLAEARKSAPDREDVYVLLARACTSAGFYADAAEAWSEYLKRHPEDELARREKAFAQARGGDLTNGTAALEQFVAKHPKDAVGHFQLGVAYTVGDPAMALDQLGKALQLQPDLAEALYARGTLLLQTGEAERAAVDLERTVKLQPQNARALDQLGQAYRKLGQKEKAESVLREAVRLSPYDGPTALHLAHVLRDNGKGKEAETYLQRFKQYGGVETRVAPRGLLGYLNLNPEQQRERYLSNLKRAVTDSPQNVELRLRLGEAQLERGEYAAGEQTLSELKAEPPVMARAGAALLTAGRYDAARSILLQAGEAGRLDLAIATFHTSGASSGMAMLDALPESQRNGDYWLLRAQMLESEGKTGPAGEALQRGLAAAPTRADLYHQAALFLIKNQQFTNAQKLLEQATAKFANEPELLLLQAITYELSDRTDLAAKLLRSIQQRWPEWYRPRLVYGIALAKRAQSEEAKREIEQAIALGAEEGEAYYYLADTILRVNPDDVEPARQAIQVALSRSPEDPYVHALAGKIEAQRGNSEAAIQQLRRAAELMPALTQAHAQLAQLYGRTGRKQEAAAEAELVRKLSSPQQAAEPPAVMQLLFGLDQKSRAAKQTP